MVDGSNKLRMLSAQPRFNILVKLFRQGDHLRRLLVGNSPCPLVAPEVPLLPKCVEAGYEPGINPNRISQGVNHSVMMGFA